MCWPGRVCGTTLFLDDYLEGALYGPGGTYHFTHRAPSGAPPAFSLFPDLDHIVNEHQNLTGAYLYTEPATVALI